MARVTLRITGTQLLCQDEHPSLLAALESHNVAVEYQCREGYCVSFYSAGGNFALLLPGKRRY